MLIVAVTSALIALVACDSLDLLPLVFGEVRVPEAVYAECIVGGKPWSESLAAFLIDKVVGVDRVEPSVDDSGLGLGEAEAMALYRKLAADRLLVDDGRARRVAARKGIRIVGSLGVLVAAKLEGRVDAVAPLIETVRSNGIYLSDALVFEALRLAGEG